MSDTPFRPGEKYQPSCGTEGADFMAHYCDHCIHDQPYRDGDGDSCEILMRTFVHDVDDPEYPEEWQYDKSGWPTCTEFTPANKE